MYSNFSLFETLCMNAVVKQFLDDFDDVVVLSVELMPENLSRCG